MFLHQLVCNDPNSIWNHALRLVSLTPHFGRKKMIKVFHNAHLTSNKKTEELSTMKIEITGNHTLLVDPRQLSHIQAATINMIMFHKQSMKVINMEHKKRHTNYPQGTWMYCDAHYSSSRESREDIILKLFTKLPRYLITKRLAALA